jgi:hypothetical protein
LIRPDNNGIPTIGKLAGSYHKQPSDSRSKQLYRLLIESRRQPTNGRASAIHHHTYHWHDNCESSPSIPLPARTTLHHQNQHRHTTTEKYRGLSTTSVVKDRGHYPTDRQESNRPLPTLSTQVSLLHSPVEPEHPTAL